MMSLSVARNVSRCCRAVIRGRLSSSYKYTTKCGYVTEIQPPTTASLDNVVQEDKSYGPGRLYDPDKQLNLKHDLERRVGQCDTVDSLLSLITDLKVQPIHAMIVLKRLGEFKLKDDDLQELPKAFKTPEFSKLEITLNREINRLPVNILLTCLQALLSITSVDIPLITSLETHVIWLMKRLSISQLVRLLEIHANHQETELRQQIYSETLSLVEMRWVEISNPKDLINLFYITLKNSRKLNEKLEDKALELAEDMTTKELYRVIYILAKKGHRNTPLLRAITYHLNKSKLNLSLIQFSNMLYACSSLNVCDDNLLEKICTGVRLKLSQGGMGNGKLSVAILYSLASLRYQNQLTLDAIVETQQQSLPELSAKDMSSIVCSLAKLNYTSSQVGPLIQAITERVSEGELEPAPWLDMVWSMAVLNLLTPSHASSVLSPEFFIRISAGGDAFKTLTRHIKLLNIQAAAETDLQNYEGPKLPPFADNTMAKPLLGGRRLLSESVLTALNNIAPSDRYSKMSVVTNSGYFIDAELFVNLSGQPLVFSEFVDKETAGVKRIAVKVLDFPDLTQDTKVPVGLHVMASRHLSAEGYTVIQIPFTEFDERSTTVQKVQYLQAKINTAVGKITEIS